MNISARQRRFSLHISEVYIIDYFKQNFLYVSPNPCSVRFDTEQMMNLGYRFYLEYVPEDEQQFLIDLNEAGIFIS